MISSLHRPTKALIDLEAICQNIESVQANIPQGKQTFAVVKANAYGHGLGVIKYMLKAGINYLAVATLEEGLDRLKKESEL